MLYACISLSVHRFQWVFNSRWVCTSLRCVSAVSLTPECCHFGAMKSHENVIVNCQTATIGALSFLRLRPLLVYCFFFTSTVARSLDGGRRRHLVKWATIELPAAICLSVTRLWHHFEVIGEPPTERVTSHVSPWKISSVADWFWWMSSVNFNLKSPWSRPWLSVSINYMAELSLSGWYSNSITTDYWRGQTWQFVATSH